MSDMSNKYLDADGLFYLMFLMILEIKNQNGIIEGLKTKIEQLEIHAILDSDN